MNDTREDHLSAALLEVVSGHRPYRRKKHTLYAPMLYTHKVHQHDGLSSSVAYAGKGSTQGTSTPKTLPVHDD
jgi:hypothetical protein